MALFLSGIFGAERESRMNRTLAMMLCCFAPLATAADTGAEVMTFERQMESAVVRGDVTFLDKICASDFSFTHGDGWTTGGAPLRVEDRAHWLASISKAPYLLRELDSAQFRSSFMEMLRSLTDGIEPDIKPGIRNNANS